MRAVAKTTALEGIVIRAYPFRDSDLVLRVLARGVGKVGILARNSRGGRRRVSRLDLFDCGTFEVKRGRGSLLTLSGFNHGIVLRKLRSDLNKLALCSLLCEAYDLMTVESGSSLEESHIYDGFFDTVMSDLAAIDAANSDREALRTTYYSMSRLLALSGLLDVEKAKETSPSAKRLMSLIDQVEHHANRAVESRSGLGAVIGNLGVA